MRLANRTICSSLPAAVAVGLLLAASPSRAGEDRWWTDGDGACPQGAELRGAPPPYGNDVACVKPNGEWHGPRTTWFDRCSRKKPCAVKQARRKFQGEYRRGIEHGWWVWWHKDGRKGLEGNYYAGKKSGRWEAWTRAGEHKIVEHPQLGNPTVVSAELEQALEAARAAGGRDLTTHLERASQELRGKGQGEGRALESRGQVSSGESLAADGTGSTDWLHDMPEVDLGRDHFEGEGQEAPAYVRRAIRRATPQVGRCYSLAAARNPKLKGSLTARFVILPNGRTGEVRVVASDLTGSVNRCVKTALQGLRFNKPPGGQPVEVLSPWRFEGG